MRAELPVEAIEVLVDTREQTPWKLDPLRMREATLRTADYALASGSDEDVIAALERKSLGDLLGVVGRDRARFEAEIRRLLGIPHRAVVVEAAWSDVELGVWRSKLTPSHVKSAIAAWSATGIPVVLAGGREGAEDFARRWFTIIARRRYREARAFVRGLEGVEA